MGCPSGSTTLLYLDPKFQRLARALLEDAEASGIPAQVTSTYRSTAVQRCLYREYLAGNRILPVARPGLSLHEYGLAIDLVFPTSADQTLVGSLDSEYGMKWGGPKDPVHFQLSDELLASADFSTSPGVQALLGVACNLAFGGVGLLGGPFISLGALAASLFIC